ncbi:MAG: thioesterase family protein [Thiogranum sp.]|nr:thioesterase family protein [Thiogranum sp.]
MLSAEVELEIPFHDVDSMAVVWHGHYAKYFEVARCELLRSFHYDYPQMQASGYLWPVVDLQVKYVRPARYAQRIKVEATLVEYENRLKIAYRIKDAGTGEVLTRGHSIQVAVEAESQELQFVSPEILRRNVEQS